MGVRIDANDVLEMSEQIEKDAAAFYAQAALRCAQSTCREVLLQLSSFEKDHVYVFQALRNGHFAETQPSRQPAETGQAARNWPLVTSLLASGVGEDLAARFTGLEGPKEILEKAIDFEKDTIVFLAALKKTLSKRSEKNKVDKVIREELGHILTLTSQLATLK
ncbi:MAG: ferritin family protein [Planctomycetota bacterium]